MLPLMFHRRSLFFIFIAILAVFLSVFFYLLEVEAPSFLRDRIQKEVAEACASCRIEIGDLGFSFINWGEISVKDIIFKAGRKGGQEVSATIEEIRVVISFASRMNLIIIRKLNIIRPEVVYTDGDKKSTSQRRDASENKIEFIVKESKIEDGKFVYIRNTKGTSASLRVHKIAVELPQVDNLESDRKNLIDIRMIGRIGDAGNISVIASTPMQIHPWHIDVVIDIKQQNLKDLTTFLKPNAGVDLQGTMLQGHANVKVRDQSLTSEVQANYKDLKVKLDPMYDRSDFIAFLMNLATSVGLKKENVSDSKEVKSQAIQTAREPQEPLVGFILRGLKLAAIKVTETPHSFDRLNESVPERDSRAFKQ